MNRFDYLNFCFKNVFNIYYCFKDKLENILFKRQFLSFKIALFKYQIGFDE